MKRSNIYLVSYKGNKELIEENVYVTSVISNGTSTYYFVDAESVNDSEQYTDAELVENIISFSFPSVCTLIGGPFIIQNIE